MLRWRGINGGVGSGERGWGGGGGRLEDGVDGGVPLTYGDDGRSSGSRLPTRDGGIGTRKCAVQELETIRSEQFLE